MATRQRNLPPPAIIDKDGVWVVNMTQFRVAHGAGRKEASGTTPVTFDPAVPRKIKMDSWIEGQKPVLVVVEDQHADLPESEVIPDDPMDDEEKRKVKAAARIARDQKLEAERKVKAAKVQK